MRTLLHVNLVALLAGAFVHCSADGSPSPAERDDGGAPPADASVDAEATAPAPEVDAGNCSADRWCRTPLPEEDLRVTDVWSFGANDAVASTTTKLLQWNGAEWTATRSPAVQGVARLWASGPGDVWGVTRDARLLFHGSRTTAGRPFTWKVTDYAREGEQWPKMELIRGVGDRELWVYGRARLGVGSLHRGEITTETDGGASRSVKSWTPIVISEPRLQTVSSFWVTETREIWIVGQVSGDSDSGSRLLGGVVRGVPSKDDPNDYDWKVVLGHERSGGLGLAEIWEESRDHLWAVAAFGESFRATVNGASVDWQTAPLHANAIMKGLWGTGPNDVWSVGAGGTVRHWDGAKWGLSQLAVNRIPVWDDLDSVRGGPDGDVWAVGSDVVLHRATSQGGLP